MTKLVAVNADGTAANISLFQFSEHARERYEDQVISLLPAEARSILVQSVSPAAGITFVMGRTRSADIYPTVFNLDVYSGQLRKVVSPSYPRTDYLSDEHGNVLLSRGLGSNMHSYWSRVAGERQWRKLFEHEQFDEPPRPTPFAISPEPHRAFAIGRGTHRSALFEVDLAGSKPDRLLFETPDADVSKPIMGGDGRVLGVELVAETLRAHYFNKRDASVIVGADRMLPNSYNEIADVTSDRKVYLIRARSDADAGTYYLLDATKGAGELVLVGRNYPELDPATLPRMQRVTIKDGNGRNIVAYLTKPDLENWRHPLVVMPDDGPDGRAEWRFNFLRQFLVSRGYAVFQVRLDEMAWGSRGADMKPDWHNEAYRTLTEGARWAIRQDFADSQRTTIMGWGMGGYLALLASQRDPELYACAVAINSVTDLRELKWIGSGDVRQPELIEMLGSIPASRDSVRKHANRMQPRALIVYGTHDTVYEDRHSLQMAKSLSFRDAPRSKAH
jgi:dienelactone hydrolase